MGNKRIRFEPGGIYHIYNHGNADDLIFREDTNYDYFIKRYQKYIPDVADTFAYCLMPNHFHFAVRLKGKDDLFPIIKAKYPETDPQRFQNFADLFLNQFKNLLISYAKAFNKMYNRKGSLFLDNLNRKLIDSEEYFTRTIRYIHLNPVTHGFCQKPNDWQYSSYNSYLSNRPTLLFREEIIKQFGGKENFIKYHSNPQSFENFADLEHRFIT